MVRLILVVIVSMSSGVPALWKCKFEHDYQKVYEYALDNAIGPTTSSARSLADAVGPYVYLAPNGNDANSGATALLPKLTLASAITALTTLTRNTIHVIRNGFVGDIEFTYTGTTTIPAGKNIQVEIGEIATLTGTTALSFLSLDSTGANGFINGFYVFSHPDLVGNVVITDARAQWCWIENIKSNTYADDQEDYGALEGQAQNSVLIGKVGLFSSANSTNGAINTIFYANKWLSLGDTITIPHRKGYACIASNTNSLQTTLENCIVVDARSGIFADISASAPTTPTAQLNKTVLLNTDYKFTVVNSGTNANFAALETDTLYAPSLLGDIELTGVASPQDTGIGLSALNPDISLTKPPLFENITAGLARDITGFKYQIVGKPVGDSIYFLTSPLWFDGNGNQIGVWAESVDEGDAVFASETVITWKPRVYKQSDNLINPTQIQDVVGDTHNDYDAERRVFEFTFVADYTSQNDYKKLVNLRRDRQSMRMYPKLNAALDDPNLFLDPVDGTPIATSGTFAVDPNDPLRGAFNLIPTPSVDIENARAGYWMILRDGSNEYHLMIESHVGGLYQLVDIIQSPSQIPADDDYDFTIEYILVSPIITNPIESNQDPFTSFVLSGSIGDFQEEDFQDTSRSPMNGWTASFIERRTLGY